MINNLKALCTKFLYSIIPSLERGEIPLSESIVQNFLILMRTIYQNVSYDSDKDEEEFTQIIQEYFATENHLSVVDTMASFLRTAFCVLELQDRLNSAKLKAYTTQTRMGHLLNRDKIRFWEMKHAFDETERFTGRGVVYSAITGDYDTVDDDFVMNPNFDYILFTNNRNIKSDKWKVVFLENVEELDQIRLARRVKILGYQYLQEYDYSIWIDGKIKIVGDIAEYVRKCKGKSPILAFPHNINNCVYEELEACIALKKDNNDTMIGQIEGYKKEGYPVDYGMVDSCILVRELKHEKLNDVMDLWWHEVSTKSYRDQLSFNYAFWKADYVYDTSPLYCYHNPYFSEKMHNC